MQWILWIFRKSKLKVKQKQNQNKNIFIILYFMKMKKTEQFNNVKSYDFYVKIFNCIKDKYHWDDDIIDKIYDKISYFTNENFNIEYYSSSYDDYVTDDLVKEFIENRKNYWDCDSDWYFASLENAKMGFNDFIYEKYWDYSYDYYYNELASDLSFEIDKKDWTKIYIDWSDIIELLRDDLWILEFEIDWIKLCKSYKCVVYTNDDDSIFTNGFLEWDFLSDDYTKRKLKENKYVLCDLCKKNWFNIKDIFIYQKWNEKTKSYQKAKELYENNPFFKSLYNELNNCMGYYECFCNLIELSIDEILSFYVKWATFEFWKNWTVGYDWSIFDIELPKTMNIENNRLVLTFYEWSTIKRTYDFCGSVFN